MPIKKRQSILLGLLLIVLMPSCKKCFTCTSICKKCEYQGTHIDIVCTSDIRSIAVFDSIIHLKVIGGNICTDYASDISYQYCDNNQELINTLNNDGLICK